jgi:hypothetical protein
VSRRGVRTLPRSGYTEQPRVLTLGHVIRKRCPGTRCWGGGGINTQTYLRTRLGATPEALRSRPRPRFLAGGVFEYRSIGVLVPSPNCARVAGWRYFQGELRATQPRARSPGLYCRAASRQSPTSPTGPRKSYIGETTSPFRCSLIAASSNPFFLFGQTQWWDSRPKARLLRRRP